MSLPDLVAKPVTADTWNDLVALFTARGGPQGCWCMVWRATPAERRQRWGEPRKAMLRARLDGGEPLGLIFYDEDVPVAWCSIAPKAAYRRLGGPEPEAGEVIWSIACLFVVRKWRRQGMTARMIEAAVDYARSEGATIVEAYPVEPGSPSYRFMGFVPVYAALGFEEVALAGHRRRVLRKSVGAAQK